MKNKWSSFIDYFLLLGAVVGVGFASGKEIYNFFYVFSGFSIVGLIGFTVLYLYLFLLVEYFNIKLKIHSYNEFNAVVFGKFCTLSKWIMIVNFTITSAGMLASSNYLFSTTFGVNRFLPAVLLSIIEVFLLLKGDKGLKTVSNIVVPIMLIAIIINSFFNIKLDKLTFDFRFNDLFISILYGVLFGLNNFVAALPIVVESNLKKIGRIVIIFSITLIILLNILVLASNNYFSLMPMLELSVNVGDGFYLIYFITIIFALLTTFMVCLYNSYNLLFDKRETIFGAVIVVLINLIVSNFGFDFIVKYLYVLGGIISGVMVSIMLATITYKLIILKKESNKL